MTGPLAGTTAIVTGGSRGIGAAHCRALVRNGARVVVADVLREDGEALAASLGDLATFMSLDVTDREQWASCTRAAADLGGGAIGVLVNNAGINLPVTIEDMAPTTWDRVLAVNLTGSFNGIQAVLPFMRQTGGSIVNTSSITAVVPPSQLAPYVASKMAIVGLTRIAAMELGQYGIRVNALQPGYTDTPMMAGGDEAGITAGQPIARYGTPDEVADMMIHLVTRATYTTASVLPVDGGAVAGVGFAISDPAE